MGAIDDKATRTKFAIDEWDVVNHPVGLQRPGREPEGAGNADPEDKSSASRILSDGSNNREKTCLKENFI